MALLYYCSCVEQCLTVACGTETHSNLVFIGGESWEELWGNLDYGVTDDKILQYVLSHVVLNRK